MSLSRIAFVIPIVYLMREPTGTSDGMILILLVVASLTDFLDGFVARRLGHVGNLGRVLDPVADKIAMGIVGVALVVYRGFPVPIVVLLLYRDLLIVAGTAMVARKVDTPPEASVWGKLTTIVVALTAVAFLFAPVAQLTKLLLIASYVLVLVSGVIYYGQLDSRFGDNVGLKRSARAIAIVLTVSVIVGVSRWPFL